MADSIVKFKKGEVISRDTDKEPNLYIIKAGQVAISTLRGKNQVELGRLNQGQVIGEKILIGPGPATGISYIAVTEVDALVVPANAARAQTDNAPQMLKLILKSMSDRQSTLLSQMKQLLADADQRPCPEEGVPHVYGAMFAFAKLKGKKAEPPKDYKEPKENYKAIDVEWNAMKQFCQRMFMVPPTRLENAVKILKKVDLADMHMQVVEDLKTKKMLEKNPNMNPDELPKELYKITFRELEAVEKFFDFFQNMFYKSMNQDAFRVEEKLVMFVRQLVRLADTQFPPDRAGVSRPELKADDMVADMVNF
jgi:hypothetical protein